MFSLLRFEVQSRWGAILGWGIGLGLFGTMYITIYPQFADMMGDFDLSQVSIYEAMGVSMGGFEEYLASTVVLFLPVMLGVYGIMAGTATLGGEEENGTLEMLLATPLLRWQIVTIKAVALLLVTFIILLLAGVINMLAFSSIADQVQTETEAIALLGAVLSSWPLVATWIMIGLFLGAYLPSRKLANMIAISLFIASYFGENLAGMVDSLEWLKPFSLFTYFDSTATSLTEGAQAGDVLLLLGITAVFFVLALFSFQRRDVTVGLWPWQRATKTG